MTTPTLLIDSRDPFAAPAAGGGFACELALALARADVPVTLLYLHNAVLGTRRGARTPQPQAELAGSGITLLADSFSLAERGIDAQQLASGVEATSLDVVIDKLLAGWHVIWH